MIDVNPTSSNSSDKEEIYIPQLLRLGVVIPGLFLLGFLLLPQVPSIACLVGLLFFHFNICIGLTFDGFIRFSRYRLSRNYPYLNNIVSYGFIALYFLGASPIVLLMKSWSLAVSPDDISVRDKPLYERPFIYPLVQAAILITAIIVFYYRSQA